MKNKFFLTLAILAVTLLSSCEAIAGIFKAGMYVGVIVVVAIVAVIFWIIRSFSNRS